MRILCLSEHFLPRVGGTVQYVYETCAALWARGIEVHLLVPGPRPSTVDPAAFPYRVTWVDAGFPERGDPSRASRYDFCSKANRVVQQMAEADEVDRVHVLFGLFLMEVLDTAALARAGVPSIATVHNLPPMECARSWDGETFFGRTKDAMRVKASAWKNNARLRRHAYARYVTPSKQVGQLLATVLHDAAIDVIGHGVSADLIARMCPSAHRRPELGTPLKLLTLGGWVPHKRQHLIPDVAERLRADGVEFLWTVAGPAGRIRGYKDAVDGALLAHRHGDLVQTRDAVSFAELAALYDTANLYVQPSTEEGFCITALDAAAAGLPVIGSPAGALPQICQASGGCLVPSEAGAVADAIRRFAVEDRWPDDALAVAEAVRGQFNWARAAVDLAACYESAAERLKHGASRWISKCRLADQHAMVIPSQHRKTPPSADGCRRNELEAG